MDFKPLIDRTLKLNEDVKASEEKFERENHEITAAVLRLNYPDIEFRVQSDGVVWDKNSTNPTDDDAFDKMMAFRDECLLRHLAEVENAVAP